MLGRSRVSAVPVVELVDELVEDHLEPLGFDVLSSVWDRAPWLDALRDVPTNAAWPRFMSVPHADAVGTFGWEFVEWAEARRGRPLRWWQRLFAVRLLEHDADELLTWEESLLSLARQLGKTYVVGDLCMWRLEQADRFDGEQLVASTGKDLNVVKEMHRFHRKLCKLAPETYVVREVNGQEEIERRDDMSRWLVRAKEGVYGLGADMATLDEAWKIIAAVVDEGLQPTMVERPQSQLVLLSTAHRLATSLMLDRRATAVDRLADPDDRVLLVEWSAPRGAELDDVEVWRMASPHWSAKRERTIAKAYERAMAGETGDPEEPDPVEAFRCQWLNQWPRRVSRGGRGEPLLAAGVWDRLAELCDFEPGPAFVAIEDHHGHGAAVAVVMERSDGRLEVGGWAEDSIDAAMVWVHKVCELHPGSLLMHGPSISVDVTGLAAGTELRGASRAQISVALPLLRSLALGRRLVHDDTTSLDDQIAEARVTRLAGGGLSLVAGPRNDLVRAVAVALLAAVQPRPVARVD